MPFKICVLVGSLRRGSFNQRLAEGLIHLPQAGGHEFVFADIGALPLYSQDQDEAPPASVVALRELVRGCDAVLFVTPEYNRSIPGVLKNAIDHGSRPYGQSVWSGKPAGIVSQSPGAMGGFGANHHLRQSLVFLDMPAMAQPEAYIGQAGTLFDGDGALIEGPSKAFLEAYMIALVQWVSQHAKPRG